MAGGRFCRHRKLLQATAAVAAVAAVGVLPEAAAAFGGG
jgi:hypothetical protein